MKTPKKPENKTIKSSESGEKNLNTSQVVSKGKRSFIDEDDDEFGEPLEDLGFDNLNDFEDDEDY